MPRKSSDLPLSNALPIGYDDLLRDLKQRIRTAQTRAVLAVNRELVLLYWQMGNAISRRMQVHGWGAKVVDRLSADLRREFSDMQGFSPRNLRYMRTFAEAWTDEPILQQVVAKLPWGHNVRLLDYLDTPESQPAIRRNWTLTLSWRPRRSPFRSRLLI